MKHHTETLSWIASGALLLAIPKCPACLAAYLALWTGIGLSFTAASYLRYLAIGLCCIALLALVLNRIRKLRHASRKAAAEPCHHRTKQ